MYCEPNATLLSSIAALCDFVNLKYHISLDYNSQTVVSHLLTHGLNLSESEGITRTNINAAIFSEF